MKTPAAGDTPKPVALYPALFLAVAAVGLFYVKWSPYYHKAFLAFATHSLGSSIITGEAASAPSPSWAAAFTFAAAYFKAVWKAMALGLLLGSLVQVLVPKKWIEQAFGRPRLSSTALAGAAALPGMMCSCCAAPVAAGLRARSASIGAQPWPSAWPGTRRRRRRALWRLIAESLPAYAVLVLARGAARAWLFPTVTPEWGNRLPAVLGLAIAGTLFVIPTAAEIPIAAVTPSPANLVPLNRAAWLGNNKPGAQDGCKESLSRQRKKVA